MHDEDVKRTVQAQFGRNAAAYVTSDQHANPDKLAELVRWLDPQPTWRVLDIATGGGHVVKAVAPRVRHAVAADLTPSMLRAARAHLDRDGVDNVTYVVADAEQMPFLEASFDAVTCRIAPHHFPNPRRFVEETARILRTGGRFLLVDNIVPEDPELAAFYDHLEQLRDPSHVRCVPEREWRAWFADAGLRVVKAAAVRKSFSFQPWVERMACSADQISAMTAHLRDGSARARDAFRVQFSDDGAPLSFSGWEWMALCERG